MGGPNAVYIGKLYTKDQIISMYSEIQRKYSYLINQIHNIKQAKDPFLREGKIQELIKFVDEEENKMRNYEQ